MRTRSSSKHKETCPFCENDTRPIKMRAFSTKFDSYFCNQECYENYRKSLNKNWNDKPVIFDHTKKDS